MCEPRRIQAGPREAFGFRRTVCGCAACRAFCHHLPGALDPADLERLRPAGQELFAWAEQHLRARVGGPVRAIVPARTAGGACHWLFAGRCAVHTDAPFGCAFFDAHMPDREVERRVAATVHAIHQDAADGGPYHRVWRHLRRAGLTAAPGDRSGLIRDLRLLRR
jgi:hypothetical protein